MKGARFIELDAGVRYWDDAKLNGVEDGEGNIPFKKGKRWAPVINLETGRIVGWPEGTTASIHYKVCDNGEYWLTDENSVRIFKWNGYYVPDRILCVGDTGFGDYIIFDVSGDGSIVGWQPPELDPDDWTAAF